MEVLQERCPVGTELEVGRNYTVQFSDALPGTDWQTLSSFPGTGSSVVVTDPVTDRAQRFYRVLAQ